MTPVGEARVDLRPSSAVARWLRLDLCALLGLMVAAVFGRLFDAYFVPGTGISYGQALVIAVVVALLIQAALGEPIGDYRVGLLAIGTFVALGLVSIVYASDPGVVVTELNGIVQNSFVFFAILFGVSTPRRLRSVIWGLIMGASIVAAVNLWQLATGTYDNHYWGLATGQLEVIVGEDFGQRIGGPGLGPNGLALMLTFCVPLAFDRYLNERARGLRWFAAALTVLMVVATMFTYSRNGFLTLILVAVVYARHRRIPWRRVLLVGAGAVALLAMIAPRDYVDRLATLVQLGSGQIGSQESLSAGRTSEYLVGLQMYAEHPVLGVGLGNYPTRYLEYSTQLGADTRRENRAPHSLYMQFAAELGALGVAWLLIVVATALVGLHRGKQLLVDSDPASSEMLAAIEIAFIAFLWFSLFRHVALPRYFLVPLALAFSAPGAVGAFTVPVPRRLLAAESST
jgi:O-antigen ligase